MEESFDIGYFHSLLGWIESTKDDLKRLTHLTTALKYVCQYVELLNEDPEMILSLREHCRHATVIINDLMKKGGSVSVGTRLLQLIESFMSMTDHLSDFESSFVDKGLEGDLSSVEEKEEKPQSEKEDYWWDYANDTHKK